MGYALHAAQRRVIDSVARFVCAVAGARGGKTYVGARTFCRRVCQDLARAHQRGQKYRPPRFGTPEPLLRYWVVAPTFDLCVIAQQELSALFEAYGWKPRWTGKQGKIFTRCWLGNRGVLIEFKSADRPHALVSVPLDGLWVDEAARLKAEAWLGNLRQRLSDRQGWALFTTTPLGPNWLFTEVFQRGAANDSRWHDPTRLDPDYESVHWTTADNPHPGIQADLAALRRTLPKRYFDREALASFDAFQGQVYDLDSIAVYRERSAERWHRAIGGVDFGHGAPGCALRILVRERWVAGEYAPEYHVDDEVYEARLLTSEWTQRAQRLATSGRPEVETYYCDPANPAAAADWRSVGLPATTHPKINAVAQGIRHVATLLGTGRVTVSPRCVNLRRELAAYRYHETPDGASTDVPVKANDHACDALRYGLWGDHLANAA